MVRASRLVTAAVVAAAALLPLGVSAAPAHADDEACAEYLEGQGRDDEAIQEACEAGAAGNGPECVRILVGQGITPSRATQACVLAGRPSDDAAPRSLARLRG
ncbi:hypothetical protein V2J94_33640 [Streptomyces sp. DSM 41524]|uniref:Uncharacterized protein n=2 Tax=Streptomyces violaceusniger group TaxID=2839105 RepID=A0A6G4ABF0_9ACTN|nr:MULTISPECIES: hypothetical protein [Streptomyces]MBA6441466.1 hypothetical protein [Streptomyces sp. GMR22]MBI0384398.1 hypothetical protein [Streptomyces albiflaviniger]MEE4596772.1 hypothetical protein [Streptomyces sp. DSM 41524]NEW70635.1 hypothetical protein [Streptomyces rhizosphaericus]